MIKRQLLTVLAISVAGSFASAYEMKIQGSIKLPKVSGRSFSEMAKITLQDAIVIASNSTAGQVISSALENENGFLVYSINLQQGNLLNEVIVDAGTGRVLLIVREEPHRSVAGKVSEFEHF